MKRLLFLFVAPAFGASLGVTLPTRIIAHPIAAYHETRTGRLSMLAATVTLEAVNGIDYATTRRGAFPGTGGCENNPLLVSAPCQINVARFTGLKLVVGAFGVAQWIPVWTGFGGERYVRAVKYLDMAGSLPLALAGVNNIRQLTK